MQKCLNNLGETLFLPPPAGPQAAKTIQSSKLMKPTFFKS